LFNGAGKVAQAEIHEIGHRGKGLFLTTRHTEIVPAGNHRLILVCVLPKGDRFKYVA